MHTWIERHAVDNVRQRPAQGIYRMNVVVDRSQVTAYLTLHEWRRAPSDVKAVEGGARFLLVDGAGVRRVARVALVSPAATSRLVDRRHSA